MPYDELVKLLKETDFSDGCPCGAEPMCANEDCIILQAADAIEELQTYAEWIPIKSRPMDEEERAEWSAKIGYDIEYEDAIIYTSQLPDDGEEVLTCDRYGNVGFDTFNNDSEYGCYFEENGDMDGITAWMPLPKPYKPPKEET